jgi:hypothetical protein
LTQLLYITLFHLLSLLHPFYVSVTEVRHNEKSRVLEVSTRIFYDDLEEALAASSRTKVDILKPTDREEINRLLGAYLQQHLQVSVDGKPVTLRFLGYEIDNDAAWCYLEGPEVRQVKQLDIRNEVLFAERRSQTNMLHVIVGGKRKSTKLDNPVSKASFSF